MHLAMASRMLCQFDDKTFQLVTRFGSSFRIAFHEDVFAPKDGGRHEGRRLCVVATRQVHYLFDGAAGGGLGRAAP